LSNIYIITKNDGSTSIFGMREDTVYIHNDSFPIKSAFLPPFRIRKRFHSDFWFVFTTDGEYVLSIYLLIAIFGDWKHRWRKTIYVQEIEIRPYVISLGDDDFILSAHKYFELLWWLKCSVNCSEKSYIPFIFISISLKCMLSEHSFERLCFLIRKGGKNADLIGKESLWIYIGEERSLKFKLESWPPIIGGIMKVKRANRLMSIIDEIWVIHLQSGYFINDWNLGQIFSLYTCNHGFIYLQILV
jgi:hypothetical protein